MFGRLVRKELLHHLLDFRFVVVFALCVLLSALSMYVGTRSYGQRLKEYDAISETNRRAFQEVSLNKGRLLDLVWVGYRWNRRPEVLSPVVYGLSGTLGQEVIIKHQQPLEFEASAFETDPIQALFDVLDLAFIVKVVLSLAVLLFTYDAVCGEKEGGTLRLYASFPVPRSRLALAKLAGSTAAVLMPFCIAFLLICLGIALSPAMSLKGEDWGRLAALMGMFALYLTVFAGFGLCVSAMTHRRMTAFLGLLSLWTLWIFVVPNLALDAATRLIPVRSFYDGQKRAVEAGWKTRTGAVEEILSYSRRNPIGQGGLSETQQKVRQDAFKEIDARWNAEYRSSLGEIQKERRNELHRHQRLAELLSAISPLGAVSYASADLARTGLTQQERVDEALNAYLIHLSQYVQEKSPGFAGFTLEGPPLSDFVWFTYQDTDSLSECLSRNVFHILNLTLLAIFGFAGAYVAILRYDVR